MISYIDGKFTETNRATISPFDLGFLRGHGVFESLRTYGLEVFQLDEHIARLRHSARLIDFPLPWSLLTLR